MKMMMMGEIILKMKAMLMVKMSMMVMMSMIMMTMSMMMMMMSIMELMLMVMMPMLELMMTITRYPLPSGIPLHSFKKFSHIWKKTLKLFHLINSENLWCHIRSELNEDSEWLVVVHLHLKRKLVLLFKCFVGRFSFQFIWMLNCKHCRH